jgi:hypothetical protein
MAISGKGSAGHFEARQGGLWGIFYRARMSKKTILQREMVSMAFPSVLISNYTSNPKNFVSSAFVNSAAAHLHSINNNVVLKSAEWRSGSVLGP